MLHIQEKKRKWNSCEDQAIIIKLLNDIWLPQNVYIVSVLQLKTQTFYELVALQ